MYTRKYGGPAPPFCAPQEFAGRNREVAAGQLLCYKVVRYCIDIIYFKLVSHYLFQYSFDFYTIVFVFYYNYGNGCNFDY